MSENDLEDLKKQLEEHKKRLEILEDFISKISIDGVGFEHISKRSEIDIDRMKDYYQLLNYELYFIKSLDGSEKEQVQKLSILTLFGHKYVLGRESLNARFLKYRIDEHGIAVRKFFDFIDEIIPDLILIVDSTRKRNPVYKLTSAGESEAIKMLKSL